MFGFFPRCEYSWVFVRSSAEQKNPARPENKNQTAESLKRARHYHTGIAAIRERRGVDPGIFVKIVLSSLRLRRRSALPFVRRGRTAASIVRPFIIPVWFSPLLHSSIRPFISPSISPYRLLLHTWIHPSRPPAPPAVHIQTSRAERLRRFSKLAEIRNTVWLVRGWRHLQVHGGFFFFFYSNFVH